MVHLIQCDLANSTKWFEDCVKQILGPAAIDAKKELAARINYKLDPKVFDMLFWRGDGGLYAAQASGTSGDKVVDAARVLRGVFADWQNAAAFEALNLGRLGLRISCHCCNVWIGPEPEYWSSTDLNLFIKNEREIALQNTIAITRQVAEDLRELRGDFDFSKRITMDNGVWEIYYDRKVTPEKAMQSTLSWFRENFETTKDIEINAAYQRFALDDALALQIGQSPEETLNIVLEEVSPSNYGDLENRTDWKEEEEKVIKELEQKKDPTKPVNRVKCAPVELRFPLKDFPVAKITYSPIVYSKARSFLTILGKNTDLRTQLARQAADYEPGTPPRPGILCAHMVVLTSEDQKGPHVVLGQRTTRQDKEIGFYGGRWSASIEEQVEKPDLNVEGTVKRGLKEELLGPDAEKAFITLAALFLERSILNLGVGVICKTGLPFEELHARWQDCEDRDEHAQVVALPLNEKEVVKDCIRQKKLTDEARRLCKIHPDFKHVWERTGGWDLHPTSAFRLALALWATESP